MDESTVWPEWMMENLPFGQNLPLGQNDNEDDHLLYQRDSSLLESDLQPAAQDAEDLQPAAQNTDGGLGLLPRFVSAKASAGGWEPFQIVKTSYCQIEFQQLIHDLLGHYKSRADDGGLNVFNSYLSYSENSERKLNSSAELCTHSFIVDKSNPHAQVTRKIAPHAEPSTVDFPGKKFNLQMCRTHGDSDDRLVYIGGHWKRNQARSHLELADPDSIKLWAYYLIPRQLADDFEYCKKWSKDKLESATHTRQLESLNAGLKDLGPCFCIVLPREDRPLNISTGAGQVSFSCSPLRFLFVFFVISFFLQSVFFSLAPSSSLHACTCSFSRPLARSPALSFSLFAFSRSRSLSHYLCLSCSLRFFPSSSLSFADSLSLAHSVSSSLLDHDALLFSEIHRVTSIPPTWFRGEIYQGSWVVCNKV